MLKSIQKRKNRLRAQRKARVRAKVFGTAETPRLTVFKSNKHLYAQVINDTEGTTLASVDGQKLGLKANIEDAKKVAQAFATELNAKEITTVTFDRNGYLYHGVIASFADALRASGIKL
jgi:large subunit ribosomal protein L18